MSDLDSLLNDHAHCEKKAAASALSLIVAYPDKDELVRRLSALAVEAPTFPPVHERLLGGRPRGRQGRSYAKKLLSPAEPRPPHHRLCFSVSLARSRSGSAFAGNLLDVDLARFYRLSEAGRGTRTCSAARGGLRRSRSR
jgi:tRNA-(ms[2]io[6]A)-hydroxylase